MYERRCGITPYYVFMMQNCMKALWRLEKFAADFVDMDRLDAPVRAPAFT